MRHKHGAGKDASSCYRKGLGFRVLRGTRLGFIEVRFFSHFGDFRVSGIIGLGV